MSVIRQLDYKIAQGKYFRTEILRQFQLQRLLQAGKQFHTFHRIEAEVQFQVHARLNRQLPVIGIAQGTDDFPAHRGFHQGPVFKQGRGLRLLVHVRLLAHAFDLFLQFQSFYLPGGGARQGLRPYAVAHQTFVLGKLVGQARNLVPQHFPRIGDFSGFHVVKIRHNHGMQLFSPVLFAENADHGYFLNERGLQIVRLQFIRINIFAAGKDDDILLSSRYEEIPAHVQPSEIPGMEPAVPDRFFRCVGIPVIPVHDNRSPDQNFPRACFVRCSDLNIDSGERGADRTQNIIFNPRHRTCARSFRQAVSLQDGESHIVKISGYAGIE